MQLLLRWRPERRFRFAGDAGYGSHDRAGFAARSGAAVPGQPLPPPGQPVRATAAGGRQAAQRPAAAEGPGAAQPAGGGRGRGAARPAQRGLVRRRPPRRVLLHHQADGDAAGGDRALRRPLQHRAVLPVVQVHPGPPAPAGGEPERRGPPGLCGDHRQPAAEPVGGQEADEADLRDVLLLLRRLGDGAGSAESSRQTPAGGRLQPARTEPNSIGAHLIHPFSRISYRVRPLAGRRGLQATMPTSSHNSPEGRRTISTSLRARTAKSLQSTSRRSASRRT